MSWYSALKDVIGWVRKAVIGRIRSKQESALVYWLLKCNGDVELVAEELDAPRTTVFACRSRLIDDEYFLDAGTMGNPDAYVRSIKGEALFEALEADRGMDTTK